MNTRAKKAAVITAIVLVALIALCIIFCLSAMTARKVIPFYLTAIRY